MSFDSTFYIRNATTEDIPLIMDFIKELAVYEKLEHEVVATEALLEKHLFGRNPAAEIVLAMEEDTAVGFALYFYSFSTFLGRPGIYLEDLFVKEVYRGQGYGKALLTHLAALTVEKGYGRLEWSVLNWNTPAIDFYNSLGAIPMDEWTVYRLTGKALKTAADLSSKG